MKTSILAALCSCFGPSVFFLVTPIAAPAVTFTWDGGASHAGATLNNNWSTANNWTTGAPTSADDTGLIFTASSVQTTATQNIANPFLLNSMTFDASSNVTTISGSQLNFTPTSGTGIQPTLTQSASTDVVISNPVSLSGQLLIGGTGSGTLTLSGIISGTPTNFIKDGPGTLILSGNNTFNGPVTLNSGVVQLNSANALGSGNTILFTGDGTLRYTAASAATDYSSRFNPSGVQKFQVDTNGQDVTFGSSIQGNGARIVKLGAGTLTLSGASSNTANGTYQVFGGTLALAKVPTALAISGDLEIGNPANPGAPGSVIVRQLAPVQLSTGTQVTIHRDGLLDLGDFNGQTADLALNGGEVRTNATLSLRGGVVAAAGPTTSVITATGANGKVDLGGGSRSFGALRGTSTYDLDVRAPLSNGTILLNGAGVLRLNGASNPGLAVTQFAGTLAVANDGALGTTNQTPSTYTLGAGTVIADGGNRTLGNPINITANATFGESVDGTPRSLAFTGAGKITTSLTLTAANSAGAALASLDLGANSLTVAGNQNLTIAGTITGTGKIIKNGAGGLTLNGTTSTFSGGLTVNSGSVSAKSGTSIGTGTVTLFNGSSLSFTDPAAAITQTFQLNASTLFPPTGGQLTYNGASVFFGALGAGQHVFAHGTQLETVRAVSGAALSQSGGTVTFDNVLLTGTSSFTQAAGSTLNATGDFTANPATSLTLDGTMNTQGASLGGAVAVHGGAVLANSGSTLFLVGSQGASVSVGGTLSTTAGSAIELGTTLLNNGSQTGSLRVKSGGAIKGGGSFGDTTLGSGALASPGNSIGTATLASLTLEPGAELRFELNNPQGTPGTGADFLAISGVLDLSAGLNTAGVLTLSLVSLTGGGQSGALAGFDPLVPFSLTLATAAGGITGFASSEFAIDLGSFANSLAGGSFLVTQQGNDLKLNFVPVPEPATFAPFALGTLLLLGTRKRRRPITARSAKEV